MVAQQYKLKLSNKAKKQLKKLDKHDALMIKLWIEKNLMNTDNPYLRGKALKGNLGDLWRYRVGNYRILVRIDDEVIEIEVVQIGHRREVYK